MKLNDTIRKALNDQVVKEFYSAYLYRSMSADMKAAGYKGYAHWLMKQYEEEVEHGEKIIAYIEDRDGAVDFGQIDAVTSHFDCPLKVAEASLAHEQYVSESIRTIFKAARAEGDIETEVFLQWFISEQVEEEANATDVKAGFEAAGECKGLRYMFDAKLGER